MRKKIGVFGGTFDPIHHGHLLMARDAMEALGLDQVLFVPNNRSPLKADHDLAPTAHRLAMVTAAVAGQPGFAVSELELNRPGVSYTVDTLRLMRKIYPDQDLFFIMGSDSLRDVHKWRAIEEILALCTVVVMARPEIPDRDAMAETVRLEPALTDQLLAQVQISRHIDISATEIRERCSRGLSIKYLVPEAVAGYIEQHQCYKS